MNGSDPQGMFASMKRRLSILDFQAWFPDEESSYRLQLDRRGPSSFVCPKGRTQNATRRAWFCPVHMMATHSNGVSARQFTGQTGISCPAAWLLEQKLRRAMVDPGRTPLDTEMPFHNLERLDKAGKVIVVDVHDKTTGMAQKSRPLGTKCLNIVSGCCRIVLIVGNENPNIQAIVKANITPGATLVSDGQAYTELAGYRHNPRVIGNMAARAILRGGARLPPGRARDRSSAPRHGWCRTAGSARNAETTNRPSATAKNAPVASATRSPTPPCGARLSPTSRRSVVRLRPRAEACGKKVSRAHSSSVMVAGIPFCLFSTARIRPHVDVFHIQSLNHASRSDSSHFSNSL